MEVPKLMEILSEADNAKHDTFRKETPIQTMMNIHSRAAQEESADPMRIAALVSRAKDADYLEKCKHWAAFVAKYSGGKDAHLLQ